MCDETRAKGADGKPERSERLKKLKSNIEIKARALHATAAGRAGVDNAMRCYLRGVVFGMLACATADGRDERPNDRHVFKRHRFVHSR